MARVVANGGAIDRTRVDTSGTGGRRSDHKRALVPRSTAAAATSHGARTRFLELESVPPPPVGFSCAVHRSCNRTSWMLAQRLSRSFSRQVRTSRSRVGGLRGCVPAIGGGSDERIAEIRLAWLSPAKAFVAVTNS